MTWVAVGVGGGALLGGLISGAGAKSAASSQANAAEQAAQLQYQEFGQIQGMEHPYLEAGYGATNELVRLLGGNGGSGQLLKPFTTSDWQQLSPAYDFQRQQGMQGTLNGDASGQGALSGAAQKDLMGFNQNLANTSFGNAFNMYQTQNNNIYSRLAGLANMGQSAASMTAQSGTALAGNAGQAIQNVGTAYAGGQVGAANAYAGALGQASAIPWLMQGNSQTPQVYDLNNPGPYGATGQAPPDSAPTG